MHPSAIQYCCLQSCAQLLTGKILMLIVYVVLTWLRSNHVRGNRQHIGL